MSEPILGKNGRALLSAFRTLTATPPKTDERIPQSCAQGARSDLLANIEAIATYTARHPELRQAHHFLYDLRSPPDGTARFVIMGVNPGETDGDWKLAPHPTEETSRFDFHATGANGRSRIRWTNAARYFLDGRDHVLAEIFFWSSRDGKQFKERFGPIEASPHLGFCREMNLALIAAYEPEAVILPGLGSDKLCAALYGLRHIRTVRDGDIRVAEVYADDWRPWIFTKHWTGSFGFSTLQRELVRTEIRSIN